MKRGHRLSITLKAFQMPKSSYYYWKNHRETKRHKFNQLMKREILVAWFHNHRVYGYPRIHKILRDKGYFISARKVWKLMNNLDIHSVMNKKFRKPIITNDYVQRPDLVNGSWSHFWCADITYIPLANHKWVYLASVYNPNNHKVIVHKVSSKMTAELVTSTMISALKNHPKPHGIHSDMGSQYTSDQFEMLLKRFKINHSYSLKGHPYDNTYIENFHSMLKKEYVFQTYEVISEIDWYIRLYNDERFSLIYYIK